MRRPAWSRKYLDVKWTEHGREWPRVDCWGFVREIHRREYGNALPPFDGSYRAGLSSESYYEIREDDAFPFAPVERHEIQDGDIAVFSNMDGVVHTVLMLNRHECIHVQVDLRSRIERFDDVAARMKYIGAYRFQGDSLRSDR